MASAYPGGLDSLATNKADGTTMATDHPAHHNDLADAVNKLEAELGANFSGRYPHVLNVKGKPYNATGNGSTDDTTAIQAAFTAAAAANGEVFFPPGTYKVTNHLSVANGVRRIRGVGAIISVNTAMGGGIRRGPFDVVGVGDLVIDSMAFNVASPSNNSCICISGSSDVTVRGCSFTGTSTGQAGVCVTTSESVANIANISVTGCLFRDMGGTQVAGVEIHTNSSRTVTGVTVGPDNRFERIDRYGVKFTATAGAVRGTKVMHNEFVDMIGPATSGGGGIGSYATGIAGGADTAYEVQGVLVQGNDWLSSRNNETAIFCHVQASKDLRVIGNSAVHTGNSDDSTFIAPGRTTIPQLGMQIIDNYVDGWGSFWDPDSMYYVNVADNVVINCNPNGGLHTPYGQAKYVDIHDNFFLNSYESVTADAAISTGIPTSPYLKIKVHDNTIVDDAGTPQISRFVYVFGSSANLSEVSIYNNTVHVPSGTVTGGATLQNGTNTPPAVMFPNQIHDSAGNKNAGPVLSIASAATIVIPGTGEFFDLTGTTSITSITASWPGRKVTLRFPSGALTLTDGSNLKLAGSFTSAATGDQDTVSLICDGTNWFETGRSAN